MQNDFLLLTLFCKICPAFLWKCETFNASAKVCAYLNFGWVVISYFMGKFIFLFQWILSLDRKCLACLKYLICLLFLHKHTEIVNFGLA